MLIKRNIYIYKHQEQHVIMYHLNLRNVYANYQNYILDIFNSKVYIISCEIAILQLTCPVLQLLLIYINYDLRFLL